MAGKRSTLNRLPPRVPMLADRVPTLVPGSWRAEKREGKGRFYDTRRWRDQIRPQKLRRNPLCEDCLEQGVTTPATEVDHHDGDSDNNSEENLRSLCKPCHSRKTVKRNGAFGMPPSA